MTENKTSGYPDRATAERELETAGKMNPGPWTEHSQYAALACRNIAGLLPGMDPEKAYILGLLHDIGRRAGTMQERHMLEGYRHCMANGWADQARICVTHAFMIQDISSAIGKWDMSEADRDFLGEYVSGLEYDDYDRLVQLCDSIAMATGFCLLEKRFIDVCMRYGVNENLVPRWRATFAIKDGFEARIGRSIYDILPGVRENTFAG